MQSLDTIKQKYGGIYPGFNFLRHALAFTILAHHTRILLRGQEAVDAGYVKGSLLSTMGADGAFSLAHFSTELLRPLLFALVGSFFALSGFLVADSAFRTRSLRVFLVFRVLRILPALFSEVTLSAFLLGAFITTLPLADYFSHSDVYAYLGNIIGNIHFFLPGVFTSNPIQGIVNANL